VISQNFPKLRINFLLYNNWLVIETANTAAGILLYSESSQAWICMNPCLRQGIQRHSQKMNLLSSAKNQEFLQGYTISGHNLGLEEYNLE
jgi:hypothetical protein